MNNTDDISLRRHNGLFVTWTHGICYGAENIFLSLIEEVKNDFNNLIVVVDKGQIESKLEKIPEVKIYYINFNKYLFLVNIYYILKIIIKEKISFIHSHHRYTTFLCCWARKIYFLKQICIIHSAHVEVYGNTFLSKFGDRIIAVGEGVRQNLIKDHMIDESKIILIHNGVKFKFNQIHEVEKFKSIKYPNIKKYKDDGYCVIAFIGRLTTQKGVETLIRACKVLKNKTLAFKIIIVGDGELQNYLKSLTRSLGLDDTIEYIGFLDRPEVLISEIDFLVLPSVWEGFGLVLLEGYHFKKPFIATSLPSIKEIIEDNETGLLVEPTNHIELAQKMEYLINNPKEIMRLGENGYLYTTNKFSFNKMLRKTINTYKYTLNTI